jgi:serine/threonine-protein kinase HipA
MVSAAGLLETSHRIPNLDYDLLMRLTMRLTHDIEQVERLYRLMCFNVYAGNKDDHSKNFSFLYREDREAWVLSPAYDLTPSEGMNGEHATMVNGKGKSITLSDLVAVGERNGLSAKQAAAIAKQVRDVVFDRLGEINPPD